MLIRKFLVWSVLILSSSGCHKVTPNIEVDRGNWSHRFGVDYDISYGTSVSQTLDIYRQGQWQGPPNYFVAGSRTRPTLVYIHGGAWHGGSKASSVWSIMPFVERGWTVVNIEYTTGGGTAPQGADDVLQAMQWLTKNAEQYAIDRNNIVVSGDSAGGHLALLAGFINTVPSHAAYTGNEMTVKAIINWFGISDIEHLEHYLAKIGGWNYPRKWAQGDKVFERLVSQYSPIHYVNSSTAAVLSIHGSSDKVVPLEQTLRLHRALEEFSVPNHVTMIPGGRHLGFTDTQFQVIYREIFAFIDRIDIPKP
ncbi:MAG: alpha/beta hydrolase [Paraglaciecola sp.]|uniref:alpha/beta hydrolase n=1 Tax=Paraglaciecola sp. TaxID=1920173 RepID=UPI0032980326